MKVEEVQTEIKKTHLTTLEATLYQVLGEDKLQVEHSLDDLVVWLAREDLFFACRLAKEDNRLAFDYLRCLSAVDYPDHFELVYHLYSTKKRHKVVLKTRVLKDQPVITSVTPIWRGADWHEREAAEMFGLDFKGHPHLVPLLLEEGLEQHPLLKSHPLVDLRRSKDG